MSDQNRDTADNGENPEPESDGGRQQRQEDEMEADVLGQSDEPESNGSASQGQVAEPEGGSEALGSDQPEGFGCLDLELNPECNALIDAATDQPEGFGCLDPELNQECNALIDAATDQPEGFGCLDQVANQECRGGLVAAISSSNQVQLSEDQGEGRNGDSDDLDECTDDQTEDSVPVQEVYKEGGFGVSSAEELSGNGNLQAEAEGAEDDMFAESAIENVTINSSEDSIKAASEEQEYPEDEVASESWNRNSNSYFSEENSGVSADTSLGLTHRQDRTGVSVDTELEELLQVDNFSNLAVNSLKPSEEERAESCSGEFHFEAGASPEGQHTDTLSESDPEENASGEIMCNEDVEADCSQNLPLVYNPTHEHLQDNLVESQEGTSMLHVNTGYELVANDNIIAKGMPPHSLSQNSEALNLVPSDGENNVETVDIAGGGSLGDVCHATGDVIRSELGDEPEDSGSCQVINSPQLASSSETDLYAPECDRRQGDANVPSANLVSFVAEQTDFKASADNRCLEASNILGNSPANETQDTDSVIVPTNMETVEVDQESPPSVTEPFSSGSEFQSLAVEHLPPCQQNSNLLEEVDLGPSRCTGISGSEMNDDILRSADLIQSLCENKDSLADDSTEIASVTVDTDLNPSNAAQSGTNTDSSKSLDSSQTCERVTAASVCQTSKSEQTVKQTHSSSEHSNYKPFVENLPSSILSKQNSAGSVNGSRLDLRADENLLSELDAELEPVSEHRSSTTNRNSSLSSTEIEEILSRASQPINGMKVKPVIALCEVPDQKLRDVLADFQNQIAEKDSTITRLESDKALQSEKLQYTVYEKDSYLKQLQATKSKQQAHDLYLPQIKELEYTIAQQQTEIRDLKEKLASGDAASKRMVGGLQNEMKARVDQVTQMYEESRKEKDSMVIKYAQAEHKNIELQKATEKTEGRLRDIFREREIFLTKAKQLKADYQKTCSELDTKTAELSAITNELEKHKELVTSSEVRIKWAQNKLKAELDAHKETKKDLDKSLIKIKESKEETAQIRRDTQAIIKTYQESEEMKSSTLDQRLRRKESELLLEKQEKTDQSEVFQTVLKELESLKVQYKDNLEELNTYKDKVRAQESERLTNEDTMTKYKDIIQTQKKENRELQAKIDKLFHFQSDFDRAQDVIKNLDADIRDLKLTNKELQTDVESCRKRESDLLNLTKKLTEKNAHLQSENTTLSGQVMNLISDIQKKEMDLQQFETKHKDVSAKLDEEVNSRRSETTSLTENLKKKTQANEDLSRSVDEFKDEIKTLKRRHASNIKDLTRQLQQARRKLESADVKVDNKETVSMGSRTSSNGSLNTAGGDMNGGHSTAAPPRTLQAESPPQEYPVIVEQVEIDKEVLVNRIVRLQKTHARKNEKIEFMEDHINQLVVEVKKKKKIIQHYVMRQETGALSTENMDINKAELSKRGGIMASVYSSHASDSHMNLDLSLEINKKLQSVLEDTLLKNITLKENIDTLGEEIARLSQENRRLQLTLQGL